VGIGIVAAAVGTTCLLGPPRPRAVVLIGTCGAYAQPDRASPGIGEAVVASGVRLSDAGVLSRASELPPALSTSCRTDETLRAALALGGLASVEVATTLGITVDDEVAARMARTGAEVEHLEAFSVAFACQAAGVAFAAVLGVSNLVGTNARAQWKANHLAASGAAARAVIGWLEGGAVGLPREVD
jgi:nucleoside phosphorylase